MKRVLFCVMLALGGCSSDSTAYREQAQDPELLHASAQQMTAVMTRDIFSPPQASRAYAYASVAAYEALAPTHPGYQSLGGQLNGLAPAPPPDTSKASLSSVASIHAFLTVAEEMVYSVGPMQAFHEDMHARFRRMGVPRVPFERSVAYGDAVARHILAWADADHYYKETRSAPQFTVTDDPARWQPTPPAYMDGVDPNWHLLRPFVMRTAEAYVQTAVAVADGFISAFDEKYRSALVRPETVINEHLDEAWRPALQTPPFPEYPSAQSQAQSERPPASAKTSRLSDSKK